MSATETTVLAARKRHGHASSLPKRVAEVTHALMEAWTQTGGSAPVTTHEVWEYDSRSLTLGSTSSALTRALRLGLADRAAPRGLWFATSRAWEIRRELENRVLGLPSLPAGVQSAIEEDVAGRRKGGSDE
jgi:hypothetical protein